MSKRGWGYPADDGMKRMIVVAGLLYLSAAQAGARLATMASARAV